MAYRPDKQYPPYTGSEPYLHLCFSEADGSRVRPLLKKLYSRGVRVWYDCIESADREARDTRTSRMCKAALTVVYLTDSFRRDRRAKSDLLICQRANQPLFCLNTDGKDSGLSIGLHPNTPEYICPRGSRAEEQESAILRADGFSQALIGHPQKVPADGLRIASWAMGGLALLLLIGICLWFTVPRTYIPPVEEDSVTFQNKTLREAVRASLGGGALSEERLEAITTLTLPGDVLLADFEDLKLLPALKRIELTQSAASGLPSHPELYSYTLVLIGGTE